METPILWKLPSALEKVHSFTYPLGWMILPLTLCGLEPSERQALAYALLANRPHLTTRWARVVRPARKPKPPPQGKVLRTSQKKGFFVAALQETGPCHSPELCPMCCPTLLISDDCVCCPCNHPGEMFETPANPGFISGVIHTQMSHFGKDRIQLCVEVLPPLPHYVCLLLTLLTVDLLYGTANALGQILAVDSDDCNWFSELQRPPRPTRGPDWPAWPKLEGFRSRRWPRDKLYPPQL